MEDEMLDELEEITADLMDEERAEIDAWKLNTLMLKIKYIEILAWKKFQYYCIWFMNLWYTIVWRNNLSLLNICFFLLFCKKYKKMRNQKSPDYYLLLKAKMVTKWPKSA